VTAAIALAASLLFDPTTWPASIPDSQLPASVMQAALVPGLGHWMLGRPAEGALRRGALRCCHDERVAAPVIVALAIVNWAVPVMA
jgi:hypothetical protein